MRAFVVALCACAIALPVQAISQTAAQQRAYRLTVVCWVVASHYGNEADAHRTADALRKMGNAVGYDDARRSRDVTAMASALGAELRTDPAAMERHRAACRQLGLVS